ncbi:MAG: sugar transferase [Firmicutes bacterium]|nr:sugar transferase [Bacillota bacterium]
MISFDIFDTLITRRTLTPKGIFQIMQNKIGKLNYYSSYVASNFALLRIQAEKNARQYYIDDLKEDVSLLEIYRTLQNMTGITPDLCQELMKMEVDIECKFIVGIDKNIKLLIEYLKRGERVVLISDMYLDIADVRYILIKVSRIFEDIPIYISSVYGKTKRSGALFIKISQLEHISYDNWIHYGDNYISDIKIPELLGIKAAMYKPQTLTSWETDFINKNHLDNSLNVELFFGASKILSTNYILNEVEKTGASLGGVILYPFINWILYMCEIKGLKRLYFVARDGYVLKKIADKIISIFSYNIQTKYIYGSRQAWRLDIKDSDEKKKAVKNYILQEIDFTDENFALVDLHGTGKTMLNICELLSIDYLGQWNAFYYDLAEKVDSKKCNFMSFSSNTNGLIEIFGRAPHGVTKGYEEVNHQMVPILDKSMDERFKQSVLQNYTKGAELFSHVMAQTLCIDGDICSDNNLSCQLLNYCQSNPHPLIVEFLSDIPHSNECNEYNVYAPRLNSRDLFQIFMCYTGKKSNNYYKGVNLNYSLHRLSEKNKRKVEFYKRHYDSVYGQLIHRLISLKEHGLYLPGLHKKVIIYGAGEAGSQLYNYIRYNTNCKILGWTDIMTEDYQKEGKPVRDILSVIGYNYDFCVIAIRNRLVSRGVKRLLIEMGIASEKIMDINDFYKWLDQGDLCVRIK